MKNFIVLFFLWYCSYSQNNDPAAEIAHAERSFSSASEKMGVKESFLQYFSDDCVIFNPQPQNGKEFYKNRAERPGFLTWYPTFVEAAASGDLGISSGPWEFRNSKNDTAVGYGHYFSVWKKQSDGHWKVVLDNGVRYSKDNKRNVHEHIMNLSPSKSKKSSLAGEQDFLKKENEFREMVKKYGNGKAYSLFSASNILMYRQGNFPSQQKSESLKLINNDHQSVSFSTQAAHIANSGDMAYTYGFSIAANNDSSTFMRVWRKEKEWKIAVDIVEQFEKK